MKLAIFGYGNLGRGVEAAVKKNPDAELIGIFTRRDPATIQTASGCPVYKESDLASFKGKIDVLVLCGGSATDLPEQTPRLAKDFCVVDSFDTHAKIPEHFAAVDKAAKEGGHTALISGGWDPGLFSLARLYSMSVLPDGKDYTFWGKGVSQGHSDAIRRIEGVLDARQYTIPVEEALEAVRSGKCPELSTRQKHRRECFVVLKEGADAAYVENAIKTMPAYFADYDTTVHFISLEELKRDHAGLPHGGFVLRNGTTSNGVKHTVEFRLSLDSNPEFTGSVLLSLARGVYKHFAKGDFGCKTVFDLAPADLSPLSPEELRAHYL